jgi:hypothetical protein
VSPILGIYASQISGHLFAPSGAYDSIATVNVGSGGTSSITFSSIPSTYTHLQIRAFTGTATYWSNAGYLAFNGDTTTSNYNDHAIYGSGASVASYYDSTNQGLFYLGKSTSGFDAAVIDILDYTNTNKYKVSRSLFGYDVNGATGYVGLASGLWRNTAAISSITITAGGAGDFAQYSQFALYGIKGN